jgi:hypothetical protein
MIVIKKVIRKVTMFVVPLVATSAIKTTSTVYRNVIKFTDASILV